MSQYLSFEQIGDTGKTRSWSVNSRMHGDRRGLVKWFGRWHQYTFFPESETVFCASCLLDIYEFLRRAMRDRKATKRHEDGKG